MKKLLITLALSVAILSLMVGMAAAFTTSEKIIVANQLVAIARVPSGGFTADQRIGIVNERLAYILGYEPLGRADIYAVTRRGYTAIMVGKKLLVTVTSRDAAANNTTVSKLTSVWLERARMAIPEARPYANANFPG